MKRMILMGSLLAALAWSLKAADGAEVVLDRNANVRIVEEGSFGNAQGRLRELLARYLLLALGKEELAGPGPTVTFVIESAAESWEDIPQADVRQLTDVEAFQIDVAAEPEPLVRIRGATVIAAGIGVMRFLEEHLGVFFAMPGELGLCLPDEKTFRLPVASRRFAPAFLSRSMTGFMLRDDVAEDERGPIVREGLVFQERAFFFGHDYFKALGLHAPASPSHHMIHIFPPELKDAHPEVFPVRDGRRWFPPERPASRREAGGAFQAWHPCYSEPKSVEIAVEKAKAAFAEGKYCFSLGVNDGQKTPCQCEACREAGFPSSYYRFVGQVANAVKDYYPPRLVGLIAYGDVKEPPDDLHLPENVLVMVVSGGPEAAVRWAGHAEILGIYEHFPGQGFWVPNFPLAGMQSNARFFQEHGIRFYRAEAYPIWAFDAPRVYLASRLLWDPELDLERELGRFCRAAFAEGGEPMLRFYRRWASLRDDDFVPDGVTPMLGRPPNKLWLDPVRQFAACSAEDFDYAARCLAEAESAATNQLARRRLEMVATLFEDSRTLFEINRLAGEAFDADAADGAEARVAAGLRLLGRHRDLLETMREHPEWFAGTSAWVDDDLNPSWEERVSVSMTAMGRGAIIADLLRLSEQGAAALEVPAEYRDFQGPFHVGPARMYCNRRHAWYDDPQKHVPLEATVGGDGVQFRSAGGPAPWSDHPSWPGARKVHWMAGGVRGEGWSEGSLYLIDFEATGRQGRLVLRVHAAAAGSITRPAMLIEDFGPAARTVRRRIPVAPAKTEGAAGIRGASGGIKIYLEWEPLGDDAPLEGSCRVRRVDFASGGHCRSRVDSGLADRRGPGRGSFCRQAV